MKGLKITLFSDNIDSEQSVIDYIEKAISEPHFNFKIDYNEKLNWFIHNSDDINDVFAYSFPSKLSICSFMIGFLNGINTGTEIHKKQLHDEYEKLINIQKELQKELQKEYNKTKS